MGPAWHSGPGLPGGGLTALPEMFAPSGKNDPTGHSPRPDGPGSLAGLGHAHSASPGVRMTHKNPPPTARPGLTAQARSPVWVTLTGPAGRDPGWAGRYRR